jgi:hypothetical protein
MLHARLSNILVWLGGLQKCWRSLGLIAGHDQTGKSIAGNRHRKTWATVMLIVYAYPEGARPKSRRITRR